MQSTTTYKSPLGTILLAADDKGLTGLWFESQKYFALSLDKEFTEEEIPVLSQAKEWLDIYFGGKEPAFNLPLHFIGTDFQKDVWELLAAVPYGKTTTYGQLAVLLAEKRGIPHMSAHAIGNAVGHNHISIIVPCHRVVGTNGNLTGYAGGIDKKIALLKLENAYSDKFFLPKKYF